MTAPALPCVACGTTRGHMQANVNRPARVNVTKYGVPGAACYACYQTIRYRVKHGLDPDTGERLIPVGRERTT